MRRTTRKLSARDQPVFENPSLCAQVFSSFFSKRGEIYSSMQKCPGII
jgi:hypothetical protein